MRLYAEPRLPSACERLALAGDAARKAALAREGYRMTLLVVGAALSEDLGRPVRVEAGRKRVTIRGALGDLAVVVDENGRATVEEDMG